MEIKKNSVLKQQYSKKTFPKLERQGERAQMCPSEMTTSQWPPGNARLDFDDTSQFHYPGMYKDEF